MGDTDLLTEGWAELRGTVKQWSELPADWADEDGRSPSSIIVAAAINFLKRAASSGVPPASAAYLDGDGEIAFRWKAGEASASACFLPDGHVVAYVSRPGEALLKLDQFYSPSVDLSVFFRAIKSLT